MEATVYQTQRERTLIRRPKAEKLQFVSKKILMYMIKARNSNPVETVVNFINHM